MQDDAYLLVNFGGPRCLEEVKPFLQSLLCDREVVRTPLPAFIHNPLFRTIAARRSVQVGKDYELIGGKSPIYEDTESLARFIRQKTGREVHTFHRYLPQTHSAFIQGMKYVTNKRLIVFPLFPQFSYATTGSIALFFKNYLPEDLCQRMHWIRSYPDNPQYIDAFASKIEQTLQEASLLKEDAYLLFSAHGLPVSFVKKGDPYLVECCKTFDALKKRFAKSTSVLSFQSKFGRQPWLEPSTIEICQNTSLWKGKTVVFIPLSFTSDHLETLFEVEYTYRDAIKELGGKTLRVPALGLEPDWIDGVVNMLASAPLAPLSSCLRK